MYSTYRKNGSLDAFVNPLICGYSPYLRKGFAPRSLAFKSACSNHNYIKRDFIPMATQKRKFSNNLIFFWYVLTFLAGAYVCYSGFAIFLTSLGFEFPLALNIILPVEWAIIIALSCFIAGLFVLVNSAKLAFSDFESDFE